MLTPVQTENLDRAQVLAAANAHAGRMGMSMAAGLLAAAALVLLAVVVRDALRRLDVPKYLRRVA